MGKKEKNGTKMSSVSLRGQTHIKTDVSLKMIHSHGFSQMIPVNTANCACVNLLLADPQWDVNVKFSLSKKNHYT